MWPTVCFRLSRKNNVYILLVLFVFGLQHVHGKENHIVADFDQCLEQLRILGGREKKFLHYLVS